jgi:hypothetical protein
MEPSYLELCELFRRQNRDRKYCVTFSDGQQYELTDVYADKDKGEPAHAIAEISHTISATEGWPEGRTIFFYLKEIAVVVDAQTQTVLYKVDASE